jgi:catechol 2,3-dioxygenase-like lactoylglutathione lyase family enzyme
MEEHVRFYSDVWGLDKIREADGAVYFRGAADEPYVFSLHKSSRRGVHHVAYGMANPQEVRTAAASLQQAGVRIVEGPRSLDEPGEVYGFRFADPDGRCIELSSGGQGQGPPWRKKNVEPQSICHVVLNTPDIRRATDFYTNVLGLRISDWSGEQMVFLRTNTKHHSVAFNVAPHASINHIAYLVSGVDEVMRGMSNLRKHSIEPSWGPGRHGPGNNIFCYFKDPAGYVTEYTSDIDYIADETAHKAKVWPRSPESIDIWGGGLPTPAMREAMTGEADPGWI